MEAADFLSRLQQVRTTPTGHIACCPAHKDSTPSLSIDVVGDKILLSCHAGCKNEVIVDRLGLTMAHLYLSGVNGNGNGNGHASNGNGKAQPNKIYPTADEAVRSIEYRRGPASNRWNYYDAAGEMVGVVLRWNKPNGDKDVLPLSKVATGWTAKAMQAPRPLYRRNEFGTIGAETIIFVAEGEKAADAGRGAGLFVTTFAGGCKALEKSDYTSLAGRKVVLTPDNDMPGQQCMAKLAGKLLRLDPPALVKIVRLPGLPDSGDLYEFVEGKDAATVRQEIAALVKMAPAETLQGQALEAKAESNPYHLTDTGNARRLVKDHGNHLRQCWPWKKWLTWNKSGWRVDDVGSVPRRAKQTIAELFKWTVTKMQEIQKELEQLGDDDNE